MPDLGVLDQFGLPGASVTFAVLWYLLFLFFDWYFPAPTKAAMAAVLRGTSAASWPETVISWNIRLLNGKQHGNRTRPAFWRVSCFFRAVHAGSLFSVLYG